MPIDLKCPRCGQKYSVPDAAAGKTIRCRKCNVSVPVPAPAKTFEDDFSSLDLDDTAYGSVEGDFPPPPPGRKKSRGSASKPKKKKQRSSSGGGGAVKWVLITVAGVVALIVVCCGGIYFAGNRFFRGFVGSADVPEGMTFQQWRDGFQTNLTTRGPAPQDYDVETPFAGVEEVQYLSDGLQLKAWVYRPQGVPGPHPALVFFHGGFAFGSGDLEACRPFMDAGFIVMAPMLRGENGNPGEFELFLGEVDDARAAVKWLAGQPGVDAARIYTFGHSVGGGVSAMLSLLEDVPIRHGGSSGGLYDQTTFLGWSDIVPFESTPEERSVRLLVGNTQHMKHQHYAYIGAEDDPFEVAIEQVHSTMGPDSLLTIERVPGDHFTSFDESLQRYLQVVQSNP
jgi:acetyl esterase/lipase